MLEIAARSTNVQSYGHKIIKRFDIGRCRSGNNQLAHIGLDRFAEDDKLLPLRSDRQIRRGDIALPCEQPGDELVSRHDDQRDVQMARLPTELLAEMLLEFPRFLDHETALFNAVVTDEQWVVGCEDANEAALDHPVEITLPRLVREFDQRVLETLVLCRLCGRGNGESKRGHETKRGDSLTDRKFPFRFYHSCATW